MLQAIADITSYPPSLSTLEGSWNATTSGESFASPIGPGHRSLEKSDVQREGKLLIFDENSNITSTASYLASTESRMAKSAIMTSQAWFIILVASILLIAQARASLDLDLPVNNTPVYAAGGGGQPAACLPASILDSHLADTRNCLQAAISLPDGADPGTFHNGGVNDAYRLPKIKIYGACMATVSIRGSGNDRSSWDHISYVASQLAAICANGNFPRGTTGGVKYAGSGGNIRVTLEKAPGVRSSDSGSANSTATS